MGSNIRHEIAKPSTLPDWMREFAERMLRRQAEGESPFQEITGLFQRNKDLKAVEQRIHELRERIGLGLLAESGIGDVDGGEIKTASLRRGGTATRLVRLANWLDAHGEAAEAAEIDGMLCAMAGDADEFFSKFPKLKIFIDNVIKSRGGHVLLPALLKMVRDERPEGSEAASDPRLREYVESLNKSEKREIYDASDSVAGCGVGLTTTQEELREANRMYEPPKPQL